MGDKLCVLLLERRVGARDGESVTGMMCTPGEGEGKDGDITLGDGAESTEMICVEMDGGIDALGAIVGLGTWKGMMGRYVAGTLGS